MYVIVWEFRTKHGHAAEFERVYGAEGDFVKLFRQGKGYRGSDLLRDSQDPHRYLAIDRWESAAAYEAFAKEKQSEYEALNRRCEVLRSDERCLGRFQVVT